MCWFLLPARGPASSRERFLDGWVRIAGKPVEQVRIGIRMGSDVSEQVRSGRRDPLEFRGGGICGANDVEVGVFPGTETLSHTTDVINGSNRGILLCRITSSTGECFARDVQTDPLISSVGPDSAALAEFRLGQPAAATRRYTAAASAAAIVSRLPPMSTVTALSVRSTTSSATSGSTPASASLPKIRGSASEILSTA